LSWSETDSERVLNRLGLDFKKTPRQFFTEHDLHSHLYRLVEKELDGRGELFCMAADGQRTSILHHEYPTPFRCDMSRHGFRIVKDKERTKKKGLYRRGHYDLVILNPDFVRQYDPVIVAAKNYEKFCLVRDTIEVTPLLWVCEIVFGSHVEEGIPKKWADIVFQDANKVIETLNLKIGKGVKFAKYGSVMVFLGISSNEKTKKLEKEITQFSREKEINIRFQIAE
jgi:hypothetical protein